MKLRYFLVFLAISILLNFPPSVFANSEKGLIGYWSLHKLSGDIVPDKSGNGIDGHRYDTKKQKVNGKIAQNFNGVYEYVEIENNKNIFPESEFTISFAVQPNDLNKGVSLLSINGVYGFTIRIGGEYGDRAIMFLNNWNTYRYSRHNAVKNGYWTHVVFVKKDVNLDCYIDGKINNGPSTAIPALANMKGNLFIGGTEGYGFLNGNLDEVKIYNRALAAEEISKIHKDLPFPTYLKYFVSFAKKIAKYLIVTLMVLFVVYMRVFWAREELKNS